VTAARAGRPRTSTRGVSPGSLARAVPAVDMSARGTLASNLNESPATDPSGAHSEPRTSRQNFTGRSNQSVETSGKQLELLKELVPAAAIVAVFWDRDSLLSSHSAEVAAREREWKFLSLEIRTGCDRHRESPCGRPGKSRSPVRPAHIHSPCRLSHLFSVCAPLCDIHLSNLKRFPAVP
jgi:hypothetical protein